MTRSIINGLVLLLIGSTIGLVPSAAAQESTMFPDWIVDGRGPTNGCGSQGDDIKDGTDVPELVFHEACNWHDQCYGTGGLTQGYCDQGMHWRALTICSQQATELIAPCVGAANIYYLGVALGGGEAYQEGQEAARARDKRVVGRSHGDPHMVTFDGLRYGFQVAGVFALISDLESGSDIVQAQFLPVSDTFTVVAGVAVEVGDQVVAVERDPVTDLTRLRVNGVAKSETMIHLEDGYVRFGNEVEGMDGVVEIRRSDGITIEVVDTGGRLDLAVSAPSSLGGSLAGLLGNADGDPANDLTLGGNVIGAEDVYGEGFISEWRRFESDSLFPAGGSFDFHAEELEAYPIAKVSIEDFDQSERERARQVCEEAGVLSDDLESCVFDVLVSGETSAAADAAATSRHVADRIDPGRWRLEPDPPLVVAAARGDLAEVRRLLDEGANPCVGRESDRATPVVFAAQNGHLDVVVEILNRGANPDLHVDDGATALILASQNGHLEIVARLLDAGAYVDARTDRGLTSIYLAAQNAHADVIALLLDAGADVDDISSGATPLYIASQNNNLSAVETLLAGGAGPSVTAADGDDPVGIAAQRGKVSVVQALMAAGANLDSVVDGTSPIGRAARSGHTAMVEYLLGTGVSAERGNPPPLVGAAFSGVAEVVRLLLEADADPDTTASDGFTALMIAAQNGEAAMADALLTGGASVSFGSDNGWTALHAAASQGHLELVQILLAAGADPEQQDDQGAVPADFTNDPAILGLLGG